MQGTVSITVQETNLERSIPDTPEPVVLGRQAHGFPAQGLAQVDHLCPCHLISPLVRTRRTVVPDAYSGEFTRLG